MPIWRVTVVSNYSRVTAYLVEADTDLEADSKWLTTEPDIDGDIEFTDDEVLSIGLEEG